MIDIKPMRWQEALRSVEVRQAIGTSLTTDQFHELALYFKQQAFFSARVMIAEDVQKLKDLVDKILAPTVEARAEGLVNVGMGIPEARIEMLDWLQASDYVAPVGEEGTIADLRTEGRVNLILDTQARMAQGYGWYAEGQDQAVLDAWPCQELFRAERRREPRDWPARWEEQGGEFYGGRRMIGSKDDQIWYRIASYPDGLGNPYPPFAFNSGMDLRDISYQESVSLGVIEDGQRVDPQPADPPSDIVAAAQVSDESLRGALMNSLGEGYVIDAEGVIHSAEAATVAVANRYNPSQARQGKGEPGAGEWTSGGGGTATATATTTKSERAVASYNPATAEKQRLAIANEKKVASAIGGQNLGDNEPPDIIKGSKAIEVKTIVGGKNDKITMHPDALERKLSFGREKGMTWHTIVIDARGASPQYYYRAGVGSFRLGAMQHVKLGELKGLL